MDKNIVIKELINAIKNNNNLINVFSFEERINIFNNLLSILENSNEEEKIFFEDYFETTGYSFLLLFFTEEEFIYILKNINEIINEPDMKTNLLEILNNKEFLNKIINSLTEEELFTLYCNIKNNYWFVLQGDEDKLILPYIKSEEIKEKKLDLLESENDKVTIILSLKEDETKIKYLDKIKDKRKNLKYF